MNHNAEPFFGEIEDHFVLRFITENRETLRAYMNVEHDEQYFGSIRDAFRSQVSQLIEKNFKRLTYEVQDRLRVDTK